MAANFIDRAEITGPRITSDGYLVAEAFAAREGIQLYRASEIGLVGDDIKRVYRSGDELRKGVAGYSHAPVTLGHPSQPVTADNWKDCAVGEVSTEAEWKDGKIRVPLIVKDGAAISAINGGTRELSAGYTAVIDHTPGVTADGQAFDAVQRDIQINHLAIVPAARGGAELRIGDGAKEWGASPIIEAVNTGDNLMTDKVTSVVLGDKAVNVTSDAAPIIEQFKRDAEAKLADAESKNAAEIEAKDSEIGELKAKLADAESKVLSAEQLDAAVEARAKLLADAKAITGQDHKGTSIEVMRAVVKAKIGDESMSDAAVEGAFKALAAQSGGRDRLADAISSAKPVVQDDGWSAALKSSGIKLKKGA